MRQEAHINPAVIEWARRSLNIDADDAASRVGVARERLLDWESGIARPTVKQARKLANIYKRPFAVFFLSKPPKDLGFSLPHDYRRLPEDAPREPSPQLALELRRIESLRTAAVELAEHARNVDFLGTLGVDEEPAVGAEKVQALLGVAVEQRTQWRDQYEALNGWKNAIEDTGVLVVHLSGVDIAEVRGIAICENPFPLIAVNGKDAPHGRIFTLLHEFTHLLIGATGISNLRLSRRPKSVEQQIEVFCNAVAGEVLVPSRSLATHRIVVESDEAPEWSDSTIRELARAYQVSREVIVRRLLDMGLTTREIYRQRRAQYAEEARRAEKRGGPIPMPRRIIRAVGQPFAKIVISAYDREVITGPEVAELLGARLHHLPGVEVLLASRNPLAGGDE